MNCETCGNPIDRQDAERGSCTHCGAVLAHVLRAAEKAELVRRVVAQGNAVRIEGDSIEAAPGPPREGPEGAIYEARPLRFIVASSLGLILAASLFVYRLVVERPAPLPPATSATSIIAEPTRPVIAPTVVPAEPRSPMLVGSNQTPARSVTQPQPPVAPPAAPRTAQDIVLLHKAQYDKCQRNELAENPSAARRYTLAVTVNPQGRAEWVELLSEGSSSMNACLQAVTRGLDFPKAAARSQRVIVTLTLAAAP